jgi:hypothetical protein
VTGFDSTSHRRRKSLKDQAGFTSEQAEKNCQTKSLLSCTGPAI